MRIACYHLNQVGDLAFSLPALKCVRDAFPDAVVTSVARPGMVELLGCSGLVDEVLVRRGGLNAAKIGLIRSLRQRRFDLAIVFSQSAECAVLAYLGGARRRIGFINTSLGILLTQRVEFSHPPSTENNLRLVSEAGCEITCTDYVGLLKPTDALIERGERILNDNGIMPDQPIAALAPGTSGRRSVKEWSDEGFAEVGRHLIERGYRVVVLGTQPASGIVAACDAITDLSGRTNLGEALAILSRSRTLVAVDSGILHLAAAAGTKVVGLYGPSNPKITGPRGEGHVIVTSGEDCSPCVRTECKFERKCMTNIDARRVIEAVDSILHGERQ